MTTFLKKHVQLVQTFLAKEAERAFPGMDPEAKYRAESKLFQIEITLGPAPLRDDIEAFEKRLKEIFGHRVHDPVEAEGKITFHVNGSPTSLAKIIDQLEHGRPRR